MGCRRNWWSKNTFKRKRQWSPHKATLYIYELFHWNVISTCFICTFPNKWQCFDILLSKPLTEANFINVLQGRTQGEMSGINFHCNSMNCTDFQMLGRKAKITVLKYPKTCQESIDNVNQTTKHVSTTTSYLTAWLSYNVFWIDKFKVKWWQTKINGHRKTKQVVS